MAGAIPLSLSTLLRQRMQADGGWWPFDRFMAAALYEPGLGYYARGRVPFGQRPDRPDGPDRAEGGSDFITAPTLSPLFGAALARQVAQVLGVAGARDVYEFGAGDGALAAQLLAALDADVRYHIVDLSGSLRTLQAERLAAFAPRVHWLEQLPGSISGAVLGNEVLDAMPVQLLRWNGSEWQERGVTVEGEGFAWQDRSTSGHPPVEGPFEPGTVTEIHPQAEGFVRTLADRLQRGAVFLIDYGFPEAEYYHPQRTGGTLMCHRGHRADANPLLDVGNKDITAHVDFTGIALAAQEAGAQVLGYTSQARFLMNCGLLELLQGADARTVGNAQKLLNEHEMGELFKVIGFARGISFDPLGFTAGDRCHTL
jgi:SAM-dependent MidA family methyltransferase